MSRGCLLERALSSLAWAAARRERTPAEETVTASVITNATRATPTMARTSTRGCGFSLFPIFQPDGNQLRDPIQDVGSRNRPLVVGDDDEL